MPCRSRSCRLFLAVSAGLALLGACGSRTPLLVDAAPDATSGDAQQTHVSTAGPSTIAFVSDATWPWFDGNLQGPEGPSRGTAALVCVSAVLPTNCPGAAAGAVVYQTGDQTSGWRASYPGAFWIWRGDVTPTEIGDLQFAVFQRTFVLGANPKGVISIGADDLAEVMVNGEVVGTTGSVTDVTVASANQNQLTEMALDDYLVEGANSITIVAENGPSSFTGGACSPCPYAINTAGVVFGGTLTSGGVSMAPP
jgi:hypothetical protein